MRVGELRHVVQARMPALDGLRGIAILLVLAHGFDVMRTSGWFWHGVDLALNVGWIGVQLFFVLSGFLITGILLDTQQSRTYYRSFYLRRVLRIFPLYYGTLFVAFVLVPFIVALPPDYGIHQIWLWTFTENFVGPFGGGDPAFPHFWSLCVEEQFYLVWPLVIRIAGRRGVIVLGSVLVVIAIAARMYARHHFGEPVGHDVAYSFTPCRMDALAIGAMTAAFVRGERFGARVVRRRSAEFIVLFGTLVVLGSVLAGRLARVGAVMQIGGYTFVALGFAIILVGAAAAPLPLFTWAPLRRVGVYSYAMYIFYAPLHLLIGLPLLARLIDSPSEPIALAYIVTASLFTFGMAALSYHVYERRFLDLKSRLAPMSG